MSRLSYSELIELPTFKERLAYASLYGVVGSETFGGSRVLNQDFYRSTEWRQVRNLVIVRDGCCDLAVQDRIVRVPIIHHLNPLTIDDIRDATEALLDPENLIVVSAKTHNAIHYGATLHADDISERRPNDTCPWKKASSSQ